MLSLRFVIQNSHKTILSFANETMLVSIKISKNRSIYSLHRQTRQRCWFNRNAVEFSIELTPTCHSICVLHKQPTTRREIEQNDDQISIELEHIDLCLWNFMKNSKENDKWERMCAISFSMDSVSIPKFCFQGKVSK